MKKLIAALMAAAILLSLCACGSAPKQKGLEDFSTEELQEELLRRMTGEEKEATPAQNSDDIPPIEDYIVAVEITPENFGDYFEFATIPVLDEWDEPTGKYFVGMRSKMYKQGLLFIEPTWNSWFKGSHDFQFEFEATENSGRPWTHTVDRGSMKGWLEFRNHTTEDENIQIEVKRVKGTAYFIKSEYIQSEEVYDTGSMGGHETSYLYVYLKDGNVMDITYLNDFDTRY